MNATTCLQSHGREVDEEGWNSSGADSEGVQRSAHSTPHAGAQPSGPFGPSARPAAQAKEELQVTSRSRSAFIPRRLKQVLHPSHNSSWSSRVDQIAAHSQSYLQGYQTCVLDMSCPTEDQYCYVEAELSASFCSDSLARASFGLDGLAGLFYVYKAA